MRIYVKVLKGSECTVFVEGGASVLDVKKQLQNQVSIPVDQQKLVFQGKPLADDKELSHYKIGDGSKLFLLLKRPGGGATPATATSTPTPSHTPMAVDIQEDTFTITDDPTGFWGKLSTFLKRHFTEKDAQKVLKHFKKDMDQGLGAMSLDDIERLAAYRLRGDEAFSRPSWQADPEDIS